MEAQTGLARRPENQRSIWIKWHNKTRTAIKATNTNRSVFIATAVSALLMHNEIKTEQRTSENGFNKEDINFIWSTMLGNQI